MNRREFLKASMGGLVSASMPQILMAQTEDIRINHPRTVEDFFGNKLENITQNYRVRKELIYGIIGKENGKPYPLFPTGITVKNMWGFMGLGQQNDNSVDAAIKQAKIIRDSREKRGEKFESILSNLVESQGLLEESIKGSTFELPNFGEISSAEFQLESMSSYLHHCQALFGYRHPDLGVIAYNLGPSRTVEVMEPLFLKAGISTDEISQARGGIFNNFRNSVKSIPTLHPSQQYLSQRYSAIGVAEPPSYLSEVKRIGKNFS